MANPKLIRVMIVDDHPLAQTGTRHFLNAYPDLELVGTASNGTEAIELCKILQPDVILMDVMMPNQDGIKTTQIIKKLFPHIHILILTSFSNQSIINQAFKAGAGGYLLKNISAQSLVNAVRSVYQGQKPIFSEEHTTLGDQGEVGQVKNYQLTERETEVLSLLIQGLSNVQIAEKLGVSRATVKFHIGGIFNKLRVNTRAEAIAFAYREGLI